MPPVCIEEFPDRTLVRLRHTDHDTTVRLADLASVDHEIVVTCQCGATTTHPVSGGADPRMVQLLALRLRVRDGEAFADAKAAVEAHIVATDGAARVHIDAVDSDEELHAITRESGLLALREARRRAALAEEEAVVSAVRAAWDAAVPMEVEQ